MAITYKKETKLEVLTDLQWDSLTSWECDIFGVEWRAGQYVEGIFEVATVQWLKKVSQYLHVFH